MKVQFNWIHGAFHWAEEDPWRYCYSFSKPNEQVDFIVEWLAKKHEAASQRAPAPAVVATEASIPVNKKGKWKIVNRIQEEQSCKFRGDPLMEKEVVAIEVKRQQHDK